MHFVPLIGLARFGDCLSSCTLGIFQLGWRVVNYRCSEASLIEALGVRLLAVEGVQVHKRATNLSVRSSWANKSLSTSMKFLFRLRLAFLNVPTMFLTFSICSARAVP